MSFQNRFKGKTSVMTKDGIFGIVNSSSNPIEKNSVEQFNNVPEKDAKNVTPAQTGKQIDKAPLRLNQKNTTETLSVSPNLIEHERKKNFQQRGRILSDSKHNEAQSSQSYQSQQVLQKLSPDIKMKNQESPFIAEKIRDYQREPENYPRNLYDSNGQMIGYSQYMRNELKNYRGNIFSSHEDPLRPARLVQENNTAGTDFKSANINYQKRSNGTPLSLRDVPGSFVKGSQRKNNVEGNNISINTYEPSGNANYFGPSSEVMITDSETKSVGSSSFLRNGLFKPYTIKEYRELQKHSNFNFGGLGANIGAEDWKKEKEKREKMADFANKIRMNPVQKSPIFFKEKGGELSTNSYVGRNSSVDVVSRLHNQPLRTIPERSGVYNEMQDDEALNQLEQQYDYKGINFLRRQF